MVQVVSLRPVNRTGPGSIPYPFRLDMWRIKIFVPVLRFSPVGIIPPLLQTHLHTHVALSRRTSGAKRGSLFKSNGLWQIGAHWIEKYFHFVFWGLKSRFLRIIATCIYVKYARGPVFLVGTISWRRRYQRDGTDDVAAQMSRSSGFRVKIPSAKNWQPSNTAQWSVFPSLPFHSVTKLHIMWTRDIWWRNDEGGEVVTKRRKWNKKSSLQVCNQVVTQRVIWFQLQK
jgi:hypothetical protein